MMLLTCGSSLGALTSSACPAITTAGRALAIIDVTDDMSGYNIPIGSTAQVAIYTHHWHHVSLIRKILLRMRSWQNYVFLEGH